MVKKHRSSKTTIRLSDQNEAYKYNFGIGLLNYTTGELQIKPRAPSINAIGKWFDFIEGRTLNRLIHDHNDEDGNGSFMWRVINKQADCDDCFPCHKRTNMNCSKNTTSGISPLSSKTSEVYFKRGNFTKPYNFIIENRMSFYNSKLELVYVYDYKK